VVALSVVFNLLSPEFPSGFRDGGTPAPLVTMKEAGVHEDDLAVSRKNDVGCSRQIAPVEAEAVAHAVNQRTDMSFRDRILRFDVLHDCGAFGNSKHIRHA
jgi:hypothetical protein